MSARAWPAQVMPQLSLLFSFLQTSFELITRVRWSVQESSCTATRCTRAAPAPAVSVLSMQAAVVVAAKNKEEEEEEEEKKKKKKETLKVVMAAAAATTIGRRERQLLTLGTTLGSAARAWNGWVADGPIAQLQGASCPTSFVMHHARITAHPH